MKISKFFLFLMVLSGNVMSQDSSERIFHLQKIPPDGLLLDKDWKFKGEDNKAFSQLNYDDNAWAPIDPTGELHHLPAVRDAAIGWFRLKMEVDSSLLGEGLTMVVSNIDASEIYLDGKLLYRFGNVSKNYQEEKTDYFLNHLLSFKLGKQPLQIIAVRYSFNKENLYLKFTDSRPVVDIVLKETNRALSDHLKNDSFESTLRSIQLSFYLPLGFLLLFLFLSYRLQKEYLYFGIFCFYLFIAILLHINAFLEPTTFSRTNAFLLITQVFYLLGALAFLNGTYVLYNQKKSWFYYVLILYGLIIIPFFFISYDSSGLFNVLFFPVINIEFLRLNLIAVQRHRPGAWILLITSLLLTISFFGLVWFSFNGDIASAALLQSISFIIPGLGLSLFFAGEFARTGSSLHQRVIEIETLSKDMIANEKEKQQILSAQNETLEKQVTQRTAELSKSLKDLKGTQAQLIQSEKMASLGELTAGIAHEIQNPLNFVNNFSEVNTELIAELEQEIDNGNIAEVKSIANDIKENEQKINHHGQRAGAIVKSMLQHSRTSSGQKEFVNINTLINEYLRLAYHGMRAKDKFFEVELKKDFDESLQKIEIIPQDIGRVLLNLFNNAFYVVDEKKKTKGEDYQPVISVQTKRINNMLELRIKDNGNGIPHNIIEKIFQPFFTTRPTGEGTGLGLSLSYDIIKAHNGKIQVETKEGEETVFVILLPL
jgi:two-component system, NtrC family, sensor kinase